MNDTWKYLRGQVWMRNCHSEDTPVGHVQTKNRPFLIISSDYGNQSSSLVTVVPITSADKSDVSINIPFYNMGTKETNYILCNQIETINKFDMNKYLFTLNPKIMIEVNDALRTVQELNYFPQEINTALTNLEASIENFNEVKTQLEQRELELQQIKKLSNKIYELYKRIEDIYE